MYIDVCRPGRPLHHSYVGPLASFGFIGGILFIIIPLNFCSCFSCIILIGKDGFYNEGLKRGEERVFRKFENVKDSENWSLYREDKKLLPLQFSNGKTQEDVVKEIVELIRNGNKIIFLHGQCGTGKSAIALNVARVLGKTTVVVPVKALQKQYEDDYTSSKFLFKKNGQKMK